MATKKGPKGVSLHKWTKQGGKPAEWKKANPTKK